MASVEQVWKTLKEAIPACTGLSSAAFFTVVVVGFAFYYAAVAFFVQSHRSIRRREKSGKEMEQLLIPVQLGEITEEELNGYDGSDPKKPLLMGIKGQIYDVSLGRIFYGPGGPYASFAGKDASRALAKMSFEDKDLIGDISGLEPFELEALQDWEYKFIYKYVKVGTIKKSVPATDDPASDRAERTDTVKPAEVRPSESPDESTHHREVSVEDAVLE